MFVVDDIFSLVACALLFGIPGGMIGYYLRYREEK